MAGCSGVAIPGDMRGCVGKARFVRAEAARVNFNRRTFGAAQAREVAQRLGLPEEAWRTIPAPLATSTDEDRRGYRVVQAGRDQCPSVPIKASTLQASKMPSSQDAFRHKAQSWSGDGTKPCPRADLEIRPRRPGPRGLRISTALIGAGSSAPSRALRKWIRRAGS